MGLMQHVRLLAADEPAPFTVEHADGASDFLIVCDHASRRIPRQLGKLGLTDDDLLRHIAWDIGAAAVARRMADQLDAFVITQSYSRLVIDCNRPPRSPQSIVTLSERTHVPGNENLSAHAVDQRIEEIFAPYHARIVRELDQRQQEGRRTIVVTMHSFTPVFLDQTRSLHAGVLYNHDTRFAHHVLAQLREDPELLVGDNAPYRASEATDYALVVHGEKRGLACVELEVRQDLIEHERGQQQWADRLTNVLERARLALFPA
jgi:predicted N-formylglutamate amidohydrolase